MKGEGLREKGKKEGRKRGRGGERRGNVGRALCIYCLTIKASLKRLQTVSTL